MNNNQITTKRDSGAILVIFPSSHYADTTSVAPEFYDYRRNKKTDTCQTGGFGLSPFCLWQAYFSKVYCIYNM